MKCLMCKQAEPQAGLTAVTLKRGELTLTLKNIPALVCPACGESYVSEETAIQLLAASEKKRAGFLVNKYRIANILRCSLPDYSLQNFFYPPNCAAGQAHFDAMRMGGGVGQEVFDHALGQFAGGLVLFEYDTDALARFDTGA
jgi:YgiT-type zinc finger domain-containing protein